MVDDSTIPSAPAPSLGAADVAGYLAQLKVEGWDVFKRGMDGYYIQISDTQRIVLKKIGEGQWLVSAGTEPTPMFGIGGADNAATLRTFINKAFVDFGLSPSRPPTPQSALLYVEEPLTNLDKIASFINHSTIQAMFDPYLDDKTLVIFSTILGLSNATIDPNFRFITATDQTVPNKKGLSRLTKTAVDAWFKQMGVQGEVRHVNYQGHQRRFMLLSGGQTLILGPSLNNPFTNEHVSIDHNPDNLAFFDKEWAKGTPL